MSDALTPHDLLLRGIQEINVDTDAEKRWKFYEGNNDKPFAPKGVNTEYEALRDMARLPLTRLAVRTPVQRLSMVGLRSGGDEDTDEVLMHDVLRFNKMPSRQRILYIHALVFGYGVASVWPNKSNPDTPHIYVEDPRNIYLHLDPRNPFSTDWAVKVWQENETTAVAILYTDAMVYRFEAEHDADTQVWNLDNFELADSYRNPMGRVPFVLFAAERHSDGGAGSMIDALIPQQRAIDTMRFNVLLAAQFAAFRQRIVVGYDPVQRDGDGNPMFRTDAEGNYITDQDGQPIPIINSPGRAGVDRLLVFPGSDTKVTDLNESNLDNYVKVLDMLVATFASTAQVPPQYLVGDFKNVSGDLMTATEATLRSLTSELQTQFGDAWLSLFDLVSLARGEGPLSMDAQIVWEDATPLDLSQVSDAASKMVPQGAPLEMFLEMIPGATPQKVKRWMGMSQNAMTRQMAGSLAASAFGPKVPLEGQQQEVVDDGTSG